MRVKALGACHVEFRGELGLSFPKSQRSHTSARGSSACSKVPLKRSYSYHLLL